MMFDNAVARFLINRTIAINRGVDEQRASQLALLTGFGLGLLPGVVITEVLANRDAATVQPAPPAGTATGTTTGTSVLVPDFAEFTFDQAKVVADSVGLKLLRQDLITQNSPKDTVVQQSPQAESFINSGGTVTVFVSKGFPLPDFRGNKYDDVANQYGAVLTLKRTDQTSSSTPAGAVICQEPSAGAFVSSDSEVTLFVSSGPAVT